MPSSGADVGVLTTDRELVVRSWDAWMADATGIPAEVACGRPLAGLFPEVEQRGLSARLRRVVSDGTVEVLAPAFHQYLIPCAPREPAQHFARMQQHVTLAPLRAGAEIVGVTIGIRDVTARRERERRIAEELESGDEGARLRAVEALAAEEASPDVLVDAFDDASWRVRGAAVEAMARHAGEGVAEVLARVLREQHRDLAVLNATLSALAASGEEVLPSLLGLLESDDADLRVYVALALGLRGDPGAVPALVRAMDDPDANVRFHALEALGRLRARDAAPAIAAVAESRDFSVAFAALDALAAIGDETAAPRIVPLLDDELLRPAALSALGRLGGEESVAPLVSLLARPDVAPAEVAEALATIHARYQEGFGDGEVIARLAAGTAAPGVAPVLVAALGSASGAELSALARVLGWLEAEGAAEPLVRALAHADARAAAAEGLVRLGARAVDALVAGIAEMEEDALRCAVGALGRIGAPAAVPALLALLRDAPDAAAAVADALGRIGDGRAFEPLVALLGDSHAAVRQAAVGALSSIGHPALQARTAELLRSESPAVRESAARIAGYFGYRECADALVELCHDGDESVRRAAVEHLVFLEDPRTGGALRDVLASGTGTARAAAARALAQVGPRDAAELLPGALADTDLWVRYYAARSAGSLGTASLVPRIAELALRDPAVPVRIAAAEALGAIATAEAVAALAAVAEDTDPELRLAALGALARAGGQAALPVLRAALAADDPGARQRVIDALGPQAAQALAAELAAVARETRDEDVATAAVFALLRGGTAETVHLLCRLAAEPRLRGCCVQALARVPDPLLEVLAEELGEGDEAAREAVASALAHVPHARAERIAAMALGAASPAVRRSAELALARLDLRATVAGA
ncbi:MAG TPA: HEAT repeat domain-containing protein [Longimicrobium sp.]|nr:HEAT repeat domain-containing protein [Longimicrobium sp.]